MNTPQVVVAGGGIAGTAAAIALARTGVATVLCQGPLQPAAGETLPQVARPALAHLGVLEALSERGDVALSGSAVLQAWGGPALVERSEAVPGWHVCRERLDALLLEKSMEAGVSVLADTTIDNVRDKGGRWRLELRSPGNAGTSLACDFILDATGRRGAIARRLGAHRLKRGSLVAVRTRWHDPARPSAALLIESHETGWACAVPLPGDVLVAAIFTDADLLPRPAAGSWERENLSWMFPRLAERLAGCTMSTVPAVLPAHDGRSSMIAGERWAAVGDAAVTFDPLSSAGMHFALGSALHVIPLVLETLGGGPAASSRRAYEQALATFEGHLWRQLATTYSTERRWPQACFWRRRHTAFEEQSRVRHCLGTRLSGLQISVPSHA